MTEPGLQARSETVLSRGAGVSPAIHDNSFDEGQARRLPHGYSTGTISASITCSSLLMQSWFMLVLRS